MDKTAQALELLGIICSSFPSQSGASGADSVKGYVIALDGIDPDAVVETLTKVIKGTQKGFGRTWRPTPAELAEWARETAWEAKERDIPLYTGNLNTDFGHGLIDLRGLTEEEQDRVFDWKGISPQGHNLAMLTLEEKRDVIAGKTVALPFRPKLQRIK